MIDPGLAALVLVLGFAVSCLSGFLGIGGGIVMAPALLYLPALLGTGTLEMREVAGLTITQGLFACFSGALRHDRYHCVDRRLVTLMGATIVFSALAGSITSRWFANETLMLVFAALALFGAVLMFLPKEDGEVAMDANGVEVRLSHAVLIALAVGFLGGLVGQGGSFILIPLMLHVLALPTRVVIGTNLALVVLSSLAGFVGKLSTGQIPLLLAAVLVVGAVPGAQIGSVLGHDTRPKWLRLTLAGVVTVAAVCITVDAL